MQFPQLEKAVCTFWMLLTALSRPTMAGRREATKRSRKLLRTLRCIARSTDGIFAEVLPLGESCVAGVAIEDRIEIGSFVGGCLWCRAQMLYGHNADHRRSSGSSPSASEHNKKFLVRCLICPLLCVDLVAVVGLGYC
jgi:hypothetical protein